MENKTSKLLKLILFGLIFGIYMNIPIFIVIKLIIEYGMVMNWLFILVVFLLWGIFYTLYPLMDKLERLEKDE